MRKSTKNRIKVFTIGYITMYAVTAFILWEPNLFSLLPDMPAIGRVSVICAITFASMVMGGICITHFPKEPAEEELSSK